MNAPNFEAVTARAGYECRGGLLVGLGNSALTGVVEIVT